MAHSLVVVKRSLYLSDELLHGICRTLLGQEEVPLRNECIWLIFVLDSPSCLRSILDLYSRLRNIYDAVLC